MSDDSGVTSEDEERTRVRIETSGTDADEAMHDLERLYGADGWHIRQTGPQYRYRYAAVGASDTMTLRTTRMLGRIGGEVPQGDDLVIQWFVSGSGLLDLHDEMELLDQGFPALSPPHRPFRFDNADYDQKIVQLNRGFVELIASERWAFRGGGLLFDHRPAPRPDALARWRAAISTVTSAMRVGPVGTLLWDGLAREVTLAFLQMYPPVAEALPEPLLTPRNSRIRHAIDHIHENAHRPLALAEIAGVADLSARSVQDAFRRLLGVTPLEYVRQVRLDRARVELTVLDPTTTTVADVARRWGFSHLGRFSASYRARFDEYPSDTLRG